MDDGQWHFYFNTPKSCSLVDLMKSHGFLGRKQTCNLDFVCTDKHSGGIFFFFKFDLVDN